MEIPSQSHTIGALAAEAGVNVETIRFYQRKKLLPEPERPRGGIRRYGPAEVSRVRFIKAAQRIGFTLDEIAQLLQLPPAELDRVHGFVMAMANRYLALRRNLGGS